MGTKGFKTKATLTATALASALLVAAGTAQAQNVLSFLPGANATGIPSGSGIEDLTVASPPKRQFDKLVWDAGNNDLRTGGDWKIKSSNAAGTAFTETFTFMLNKLQLGFPPVVTGVYGDKGSGAPDYTNSYVTMVVDTFGTTNGGFVIDSASSPAATNLNYTGGTMTMYFHTDGVAEDCGGTEAATCNSGTGSHTDVVKIADFTILSGTARPVTGNARTDLAWNVQLNTATNTAFFNADGSAITSPTLFAFTDQQVLAGTITEASPDADNSDAEITVISNGIAQGGTIFVAEPGTLALFGAGLVGLGFAARRQRKAKAAA